MTDSKKIVGKKPDWEKLKRISKKYLTAEALERARQDTLMRPRKQGKKQMDARAGRIDSDIRQYLEKLKEANRELKKNPDSEVLQRKACIETRAAEAMFLDTSRWAGKADITAKKLLLEAFGKSATLLAGNKEYQESVLKWIERIKQAH